jgi:DNA-binding response OmpR family regulator
LLFLTQILPEVSAVAFEKTALVVDDEEKIAEMVAAVLRVEGFQVCTATSGLQGYSSYFCDPTHWVVTDVEMPGLDGIEMVQCIRVVNPEVKVIYMTGAIDAHRVALEKEGRNYGANILRKPFSYDTLVSQITAPQNSISELLGVDPRVSSRQ